MNNWGCTNKRQARSPKNIITCASCHNEFMPNSSRQKVCINCRSSWYLKNIKKWQSKNVDKVIVSKNKCRVKQYLENPDYFIKKSMEYINRRNKIDPMFYQSKLARSRAWWKYSRNFPDAICPECGISRHEVRFEIHHIDENPFNNTPENVKLLCVTCHKNIHIGKHLLYK